MIRILAGVNGAGKSSIAGASLRANGVDYYNPDEVAGALAQKYPLLPRAFINARVWEEGVKRLKAAVRTNTSFTFETTLGGSTITGILSDALDAGIEVQIWYCGLESVDKHIERVSRRVARGGHDIPGKKIHERYTRCRKNICGLANRCNVLHVYDNSADLDSENRPNPRLLFISKKGVIEPGSLDKDMPDWARPIALAAAGK